MPKSKKQIAKEIRLKVFHALEEFIPHNKIWEAFERTFWTCPLCGSKVNKDGCEGKDCWNHPASSGDHRGEITGDYPILGIECPRCEFEGSTAPLCHKCRKEVGGKPNEH